MGLVSFRWFLFRFFMAQLSCPLNDAVKRATDCSRHFIILLANLMIFAELKNIRQDNKDCSRSKLSRLCYVILFHMI